MGSENWLKISLDEKGLQKIILNRPEKKNAMSGEMIESITSVLRNSSINPKVQVIVFTGVGKYFTSGNDLSNFMNSPQTEETKESTIDDMLQKGRKSFQNFVAAFIDCPKILVAIVNGPAIGIGVTILAHFDIVFASESATFHCPFTKLGQTPEGCSTLLFPMLMGYSKATDLLLFNKKITATEAFHRNLVTEVYDENSLHGVWQRVNDMCSLPPSTVLNAKVLLRKKLSTLLHETNEEECKSLVRQWSSEEFMDALLNFMMKKSKL